MANILTYIILPLNSEIALYFTLFAILVISGFGVPIPEEVALLLGGYLAYLEFVDFWAVFYVLVLGILLGDLVGYALGRYGGNLAFNKLARFRVIDILFKKGEWYFKTHGEKVVIFSRALVGVRFAVPIMAGHFRMNFLKFVLYDTIAVVPWTFFIVYASYYLGFGLEVIKDLAEIRYGIAAGVFALIAGYGIYILLRERKARQA